ncbi:MAG: hypothetical protein KKD18_03275 [Nanoarchaeota archaeon]|nr:hypothetical protein [Nanoarchaeota archaeon]
MEKYNLPINCRFQIEKNVSDQGLWDVCLWDIDEKHVGYGACGETIEEALENFAKDLPKKLI